LALGTTAPLVSRTRTRIAPVLPLKTGRGERMEVPEGVSSERGEEKRATSKSSGVLGFPSGPLLMRRRVLILWMTGVWEVVWDWP